MHTVVVRVWLPDRPGALGQVASRIGAVRGDVLGIEVLESGAGSVIDELVVVLPDEGLVALMVNEIDAVDGVSVEDVRAIEGGHVDPDLTALALLAEVAESAAGERPSTLVTALVELIGADWAVLLRDGDEVARAGELPDEGALDPYRRGREHPLSAGPESDVFWSSHPDGPVLVARRSGRPIHTRERDRVDAIMRVAASLLD
ncbi:MAG: ACT domain-containing protein [Ilumatobacteraceae bacterium]|nr:ACT domain-containing protein [Ilumatobacteraceae bacterium]